MYGSPQLARGSYNLTPALSPRRAAQRRRRLALLSALTPEQAVEMVFPKAKVGKSAGHNQAVRDLELQAVNAGYLINVQGQPAYTPGGVDCQGVSLTKPALMGTIGSLALSFAPKAFAAGPIVGGIVLAIGGISELFSAIFGHHAKAIAKERSTLCAAVPAANQTLQLIDQALQNGQAGPADAIQALDALINGFNAQVASIRKGSSPTSSGECNAACVMASQLQAIVNYKKSVYQDLLSQPAASSPAGSIVQNVQAAVASAGLPSWVLPAAAFFALWELV